MLASFDLEAPPKPKRVPDGFPLKPWALGFAQQSHRVDLGTALGMVGLHLGTNLYTKMGAQGVS